MHASIFLLTLFIFFCLAVRLSEGAESGLRGDKVRDGEGEVAAAPPADTTEEQLLSEQDQRELLADMYVYDVLIKSYGEENCDKHLYAYMTIKHCTMRDENGKRLQNSAKYTSANKAHHNAPMALRVCREDLHGCDDYQFDGNPEHTQEILDAAFP